MRTVWMSEKGKITIPADVRKQLGWKAGTTVEFVLRENEIIVRQVGTECDEPGFSNRKILVIPSVVEESALPKPSC